MLTDVSANIPVAIFKANKVQISLRVSIYKLEELNEQIHVCLELNIGRLYATYDAS